MRILFTVSLLLAGFALPGAALAARPDPKAVEAQKSLDRVRSRIEALNKSLDRDREQRDSLDVDIEEAEKSLLKSQSELKRLVALLAQRQAELARTQTERDASRQRLVGERAALARQLRAVYLTGQRSQTKLLLSQDNAAKVGRLLTYSDYLSRARASRVQAILADVKRATDAEARIRIETASIAETKGQQEIAVIEERQLNRKRQSLLARLTERIDDEQDQLKRLQQGEREVTKVLENIHTVLADTPVQTPKAPERDGSPARSFGQGRGKMTWPLRGELLANYGDPKVGAKLSWKGLWIAGDRGAPVRASARGRVAFVGWMHRYGLITIVEHEDNYFTLYGHLESTSTKAGDSVQTGEAVGTVGDSGGHDATGLYFEVRKGTEPMNPRDWLQP